tara:strand:- start:54 stop:626 length:573 start_codon:yes stop_codon:yes gene_type:complete
MKTTRQAILDQQALNRKIYASDSRYKKVYEQMQLLDIQEVTTKKQSKNGTREFKLPIKDQHGKPIYVASFASGYVRRTKANGYSPSWQINKRCESEPQYYEVQLTKSGQKLYRKYTTWTCKLIPNEADRLEYLIAFCLKNYYIGQANMLSSGRFVPKWKYDDLADAARLDYERGGPEVSVIVNGHRYNLT